MVLDRKTIQYLCQMMPNAVFLDSSRDTEKGHFDILTGLPIENVKIPSHIEYADLYGQIKEAVNSLRKHKIDKPMSSRLPFISGVIGFCSYDAGLMFNNVVTSNPTMEGHYFYAGYYNWSYVFDRKTKQGTITFSEQCSAELRTKVLSLIKEASDIYYEPELANSAEFIQLQDFTRYTSQFNKIQNYLVSGDCYQINLAQPFEMTHSDISACGRYFNLRNNVNAPYSAFLKINHNHEVLSFSPEQFIGIKDKQIYSQPIKGTIENDHSDATASKLLNSHKDKAENLMIVDLIRNDLSKVCELNSVAVSKLFSLETFSNVHHLVSQVDGKLKAGISEFDAFLSCFPGGSITGAPKKRAMEIIDELEISNRGAYCGSIFYWDDGNNFESNILIRTIEKLGDKLTCWGGGGIVVDSICESEYQESITKISNIAT